MIIALCGKKGSGKSTLSNFMHGHQMLVHDIINKYSLSENGELIVNCTTTDINGKVIQDLGILDLNQKNEMFYDYASNRIWPYIKGYSFADALKEICISLFGIKHEQVYGTDAQKNEIVPHLLWENMPGVVVPNQINWVMHSMDEPENEVLDALGLILHEPGPMTAREFMQFFGTNVCRKIYSQVWIQATLNLIKEENSPISIITDCRFKNEADAVKAAGGKLVYLTRSPYQDSHISENDLDGYQGFDAVINNTKLSIGESCDEFLQLLCDWKLTRRIIQPTMMKARK